MYLRAKLLSLSKLEFSLQFLHRSYSSKNIFQKTCLYDYHVSKGGKMVEFAGYLMPVQYSDLSLAASHLHTRQNASAFDVSHMLQFNVRGRDCVDFIEAAVVSDIRGLADGQGTLTLMTNDHGGIIDDLIVTKVSLDWLYVVSNAGCAEKDLKHLTELCAAGFKSKGKDVNIEVLNMGLIALQGPKMVEALQPGLNIDLSKLYFMRSEMTSIFGVEGCRITRCGYTGEDGVEMSVPQNSASKILDHLLSNEFVKLAGLGARDSLRLEAGLCLYGNDINEEITPVEAGLTWTLSKRRRELANFPGAKIILSQLKDKKPKRRRVGFVSAGPPARAGTEIYDINDGSRLIGSVTSGCPSPSLKCNVSIGYLDSTYAAIGTEVEFKIRKQTSKGVVTKMPFVPSNYFHEKK